MRKGLDHRSVHLSGPAASSGHPGLIQSGLEVLTTQALPQGFGYTLNKGFKISVLEDSHLLSSEA